MSSDVIGVIPARMGSSRFPGKPCLLYTSDAADE